MYPERTYNGEPEYVPLVTDLDDTLLRTDTLWEGIFCLLRQKPLAAFKLPGLAACGPLPLKSYLAEYSLKNAELFPVNREVAAELEKAWAEGRKVYMASAACLPVAKSIAARFTFFSGIFASEGGNNFKGEAKAEKLRREFGEKGFDYIGDSEADVPVWRAARTALVLSADARVHKAAREANSNCRILAAVAPTFHDYFKAFRVHQWVKNILLFMPMVLAHDFSPRACALVLLAFFSFSCCASAIYVINDLFDLAADRQHVTKSKRPFAAGTIPLKNGLMCIAGMMLCSALPCFVLPWRYSACLMIYLVCTIVYSACFKRRLMLDVVVLACLYVLRVLAGAVVIASSVSNWLLGFGVFLFLGLALLKRLGDIIQHETSGNLPGRAYDSIDKGVLESMAVASGFSAMLVAALYIDSLQAAHLYTQPLVLWLFCPLFIYWYGRLLIIAHRGGMGDDPVLYAMRDRNTWWCAACGTVFLLCAM